MCDSDFAPFYTSVDTSDNCFNTRDGNSMYYDCSKALEDEFNSGDLNDGNSRSGVEISLYLTVILFLVNLVGIDDR